MRTTIVLALFGTLASCSGGAASLNGDLEACHAEEGARCYAAAQELMRKGTASEIQEGIDLLMKGCNLDHAPSCLEFGGTSMTLAQHQRGPNQAVLLAGAVGAWTHACELGEASGCAAAGGFYLFGTEGIRPLADPAKAGQLLSAACKQGVKCDWLAELERQAPNWRNAAQ
jgi:hypothetical protein